MKKTQADISSFSYTPYSNSGEYCYILGKLGVVYPGVRVENISFPLTIPAVQGAICSCLANGDEPVSIIQSQKTQKISESWIKKFQLDELKVIPENASVFDPLIKKIGDIKKKLRELCEYSVCDESNFPVTALLKTNKGYISGVNIEFKEWNLGLCAERLALSRAVASGYTDFFGMHVYAPKSDYISPCGACRQVLFELMPDQMVELHHDDQSLSRHLVTHLLPNGFTTSSLKK